MAANMYRVGDYVFFETSSTSPYQIRRIEELNKTQNGNVEAKVMCFYRRRDISNPLISLADKHQSTLEEEQEQEGDDITEQQRHQLKHRELFLSRQVETLPATHIRGKSVVTLLNETESLLSYLNKEDTFFYSLVYDPSQKTLLADKGEIRVGSRYQAEVMPLLKEGQEDGRDQEKMETLVWDPEKPLSDRQIDQFLVLARSVGTFARALDCTSTVRQPSLHMSAAAASRDVTLYHAMDTLHKSNYDVTKAMAALVPQGGPMLCRDEMEEWTASEANLFEEALDKYGKDFNDIRQDFLAWKTLKSLVEYYYMWKTTDRYVQQKRIKAAEAESKLKQVYIPNYNKTNPAAINTKMNGYDQNSGSGRACESCYATTSNQWYSWGPTHMQCRLCASCWIYWKKYGGLRMPTRLDGERPPPNQRQERLSQLTAVFRAQKCTIAGCGKEFKSKSHLARHLASAHGLSMRPSSPGKPILKTRAAFCLITTPLTRLSRKVCKDLLRIKHAVRNPFVPINVAQIKQECQVRIADLPESDLIITKKSRTWVPMNTVCKKLGIDISIQPECLNREGTGKQPEHLAYPPLTPEAMRALISKPHLARKRALEQAENETAEEGQLAKRPLMTGIKPTHVRSASHVNGRNKNKRIRRHLLNWVDAPDDVYFVATDNTRKIRKQMIPGDFKKTARKPWRPVQLKTKMAKPDHLKPADPKLDDLIVITDD